MLNQKSINAYNMFNEYLNKKSIDNHEILPIIAESSYTTVRDISSSIKNMLLEGEFFERDMLDLAYLDNDIETILEEMDFVW
jgi:hypothetical protein